MNLPNSEYSNRDAIGARITVAVAGKRLVQQLSGGEGLAAQNQAERRFGLGQHEAIDSIDVVWPSGKTQTINETIAGKTVAVSGFGNVAWGVIKKINDLGGKVVTMSGPDGYIYDKDGISGEKIEYLLELRATGNNRAEDYITKYPEAQFFAGKRPWEVKCDIAFPSATQNELDLEDAKLLVALAAQ